LSIVAAALLAAFMTHVAVAMSEGLPAVQLPAGIFVLNSLVTHFWKHLPLEATNFVRFFATVSSHLACAEGGVVGDAPSSLQYISEPKVSTKPSVAISKAPPLGQLPVEL